MQSDIRPFLQEIIKELKEIEEWDGNEGRFDYIIKMIRNKKKEITKERNEFKK
jgi:hypothetical protein